MFQRTLAVTSLIVTILVGCGKKTGQNNDVNSPKLPEVLQTPVAPVEPVVKKEPTVYLEIKEIKNIDNILKTNSNGEKDFYFYNMDKKAKPVFKNCYKLDTCEIIFDEDLLNEKLLDNNVVEYFLFPIIGSDILDKEEITNDDVFYHEGTRLTNAKNNLSNLMETNEPYALLVINYIKMNIDMGQFGSIGMYKTFYTWYQIKPIVEEK